MKRFVLSAPPDPDGLVRLYEKDYHYLVRVRRLRAGMYFDAVLPGGEAVRVRVISTANNTLTGECLEPASGHTDLQLPAPPVIVLFQGLPKGQKMDLIVRQAAEAEVSIIVPFQSEHSTGGEKLKRWEKITQEARQQSGSRVETRIMPINNVEEMLVFWDSLKKEYENSLGILLHQELLEKASFHGYLGNSPDLTALAVGPEGGFSPKEVSLFLAAGFKPLLMGNSVLRTETAALYGIAAVRTMLTESEHWTSRQKESDS